MTIYTIGFTRKTAEEFFGILKEHGIQRVVDIRLSNSGQLAGFTKQEDLRYFLREIVSADYVHELRFAPTKELMKAYRNEGLPWDEFEAQFEQLMVERKVAEEVDRDLFAKPAVLLCSEPEADDCHRSIVAKHLAREWGGVEVVHL